MNFKTGLVILCSSLGWAVGPLLAQSSRPLVSEVDHPWAEKAVEWQNTAFIAEALRSDFVSALAAADSALLLWQQLGAQPEIAKIHRYKGYLLAQLRRPAEAKAAMATAKVLFEQQKAVYGLALTHFDWGRVCLLANELDSALYYTQLALVSWKTEKHDSRIFQANVQLMYLQARQFNFPEAKRLQSELAETIARLPFHRLKELDYWFVNVYLSEKQQDWTAYEQFNRQYSALIAEFAVEGSNVASFYSRLEEFPTQN